MEPIAAPPHDVVLAFLVQIAVLLLAARALGEVVQRAGYPSVLGEILAGVVLGPSLLSSFVPGIGEWLVPQSEAQAQLLEVFGLFGVMFLLLLTGLEIDLPLIRRHLRSALGVSAGGILVTFSSGFLLGQLVPDTLLADPDARLIFSLFLATAMSISAIPVVARVLMDLGAVRRNVGQGILAAGMSDDTVGWLLLSVFLAMASGSGVTVATVGGSIARIAVLVVGSFTLGHWLTRRALAFVQDEVVSRERVFTVVVVLVFVWAAISHALHLEPMLGAFLMGIVLGRMPKLPVEVVRSLHSVTLGFFAPVFFALAGLKVQANRLFEPELLLWTAVVVAVASGGKIVGAYLGARLIGRRDPWTALSFAVALNARGAMEIVVATIGLAHGILSPEMFSMIVVMAIVTSVGAPVALRWTLRHLPHDPDEDERLHRLEIAETSFVAGVHRVLVPVRPGGGRHSLRVLEARVLEALAKGKAPAITLFTVAPPGGRAEALRSLEEIRETFGEREVRLRAVEGERPDERILDELEKGYDLLVVGAPESGPGRDVLFTRFVDSLVRLAPCPTLIVQGAPSEHRETVLRRILVPTNGTASARAAAELGFALGAASGGEVAVLMLVSEDSADLGARLRERRIAIAREIVEEVGRLGAAAGARTRPLVRVARNTEQGIVDFAGWSRSDLIVLGSDLRPGSDRLFLGPGLERILASAPCPVIVVNSGETTRPIPMRRAS